MTRRINTGIGDVETVTTTFSNGTDLSALTAPSAWQLAFGSYTAPGSWRTPETVTLSADKLTATLSMTVGNGHYNPVGGTYWVWRGVVGGDTAVDPNIRYVIDTDLGVPIGDATSFATLGDFQALQTTVAGKADASQLNSYVPRPGAGDGTGTVPTKQSDGSLAYAVPPSYNTSPADVIPNQTPFWWVTNPVSINGRVYVGTVSVDGKVYVQEWTRPDPNGPFFMQPYDLGTVLTPAGTDDHPAPGIAAQIGKPLVAFWSAHNMENAIYWRATTQNVEDIQPGQAVFGPVQRFEIPPEENTSYTIVMPHGSDIFVLHRTGDVNRWSLTKFPAWATGTPTRSEVFSSEYQFYVMGRMIGDVIYCGVADHPSLGVANKVWWAEINVVTGSITKADGTVLGNLDGTNLPLAEASLDLISTSPGSEKPWIFDIGYGSSGREIVFVSGQLPPNFASTAKYKYAKYSGGAWIVTDIVGVGSFANGAYFPSITFDPSPAGSVVLARESGGVNYIERRVTLDGGATWPLTTPLANRTVTGTAMLTRPFTVRPIDAVAPIFTAIATEYDVYATYTGPWIARAIPMPRPGLVKVLPTVPRTNLVTQRTDLGPSNVAVYLDGTSGKYIKGTTTSASSAGLSIEFDAAADNWASGAAQTAAAKESDPTHREVCAYFNSDGKVGFAWSPDGSTRLSVLPNAIPGFANFQRVKWKWQFSPTRFGLSDYRLNVLYRFTNDDPWTTLSQTQIPPGSALMTGTTAPWEIGSRFLGTADRFAGKVFHVKIASFCGSVVYAEWRGDGK